MVLLALAVTSIVAMTPMRASAAPGDANAMCNPVQMVCGCGQVMTSKGCRGGANMFMCPCMETVNNKVISGVCMGPNKCEGQQGQGLGDAQAALGMVKQIFDLVKGLAGGGGGGAGEMPPTDTGSAGCTSYYQVTVPSSDPCAIYNPNGVIDASNSGSSGISGTLLDALGGNGSSVPPVSVSTQLNTNLQNNPPATQGTTQPTPAKNTATNTAMLKPAGQGLSGDIRIGNAGATIVANLRQGLSEVAGFFGGSTGGASQALSAAGRLCSSRPWSGTFVSNLIPTSFFDGLCEWRGYQPGAVTPGANPRSTNSVVNIPAQGKPRPVTPSQPQPSTIPPEVDIWAEPASVRLGTRTYIFWNTRGVTSCKESGPSFSHTSLSGGASTVPISGITTFNIECITPANEIVKDSVSVQIAI